MEILISGATGFVGTNLTSFLQKKQSVIGLSLRDKNWNKKINQPDVFINLIGKAHDHKGNATEKDFYRANYDLVKEIYQAFIHSQAKTLIHISSIAAIEEYSSGHSLVETDTANPQSWYGRSKRAAEEFLLQQQIPDGKKVIILRPSMIHGPGDKGNLTLLYKLISKGLPYPLARFNNKRSFLSIDNLSFLIEQIVEKQTKVPSGLYHVCDDEPISTFEIIRMIGNVTNKRVRNFAIPKSIVKGIAKVGDILPIPLNSKRLAKLTSDLIVSNQKIKLALGIDKLPVSAKDGLEKTIRSFGE